MFTPLILSLMVANNMAASAAIFYSLADFNATGASSAASYVCCAKGRWQRQDSRARRRTPRSSLRQKARSRTGREQRLFFDLPKRPAAWQGINFCSLPESRRRTRRFRCPLRAHLQTFPSYQPHVRFACRSGHDVGMPRCSATEPLLIQPANRRKNFGPPISTRGYAPALS
jgi:hypothetical protein